MSEPGIVYIAGLGHSGTTLLAMLCGSHSAVLAAGELKVFSPTYLREITATKRHVKPVVARPCSCGAELIEQCPLWAQVGKLLHSQQALSLGTVDLYSTDPAQFALHNHAFYHALAQASSKQYIVDSSKDDVRLRGLLEVSSLPVRPILMLRRLEGVLFSNVRKGRRWEQTLLEATTTLVRLRQLLARVDHLVVQYEELATAPEATLQQVWQWLGLGYEAEWQRWRELTYHLVAGNRLRLHTDAQIRLDDQWQTGLSSYQKLACRMATQISDSSGFSRFLRSTHRSGRA